MFHNKYRERHRLSNALSMAMRIALTVFMIVIARVAIAQQSSQPQTPPAVEFNVEVLGSKVAEFAAKMDAYSALRRSLEIGLPPLAVTDKPSDIARAETLLAERIRRARAGTSRGDIFTEETRRAFRQLLRPVTNAGICEAIRDDNPGEFSYPVNATYPKDRPLSTVPPSILEALPRLPEDVWYRFLRRDLILHDSRANVILDRIDDAIRCDR
jgi:hypothetical protein